MSLSSIFRFVSGVVIFSFVYMSSCSDKVPYSDEEIKRFQEGDVVVTAIVVSVYGVRHGQVVGLDPAELARRRRPCRGIDYEVIGNSKYQGVRFSYHYRGEFYEEALKLKIGQTVEVWVVESWMNEKLASTNEAIGIQETPDQKEEGVVGLHTNPPPQNLEKTGKPTKSQTGASE